MRYPLRFSLKRTKPVKTAILSVLAIIISIWMFYSLFYPKSSGFLGLTVKRVLFNTFGQAAYVFPILVCFLAIKLHTVKIDKFLYVICALGWFLTLCATLSFFGKIFFKVNYGGSIGKGVFEYVNSWFGMYVGSSCVLILLFYLSFLLFERSFFEFLFNLVERIRLKLKEDIEIWKQHIKLQRELKTQAQAISEVVPQHVQEVVTVTVEETREETPVEEKIVEKKPPKTTKKIQYKLPNEDLLSYDSKMSKTLDYEDMISRGKLLEDTLKNFNVQASVVDISHGPTITRYEVKLHTGVKFQSVSSLSNEIALAMKVSNVRITGPLHGKGTIGIEIPNPKSRFVSLREVISAEQFKDSKSPLIVALGKTMDGEPYVADISPMPHLLIAGATGTGKSMCVHSIIMSLLYKATPFDVKLILIDPKRIELLEYDGIPHLYDPCVEPDEARVITTPADAARSLKALVNVMEKRYEKFASLMVKNIDGYNKLMEQKKKPQMHYVVVIIDEFADLMLMMQKEIEDSIQRLAQMARAVGIHLVISTQRPSVDVITGVIKANFSSRIAFQVLSKTDSRVILDMSGAESLIGKGDMLFLPTGANQPVRLQGCYVSENDIRSTVEFIKNQGFSIQYDEYEKISLEKIEEDKKQREYIRKALNLILERKRVSQDLLKAHLGSSARATDVLSLLETKGFIFKPEGTNRWHINFEKINKYLQELELK